MLDVFFPFFSFFIRFFKNIYSFSERERERERESERTQAEEGEREREADTESEAGSRLWAVSIEPDCKIMT